MMLIQNLEDDMDKYGEKGRKIFLAGVFVKMPGRMMKMSENKENGGRI